MILMYDFKIWWVLPSINKDKDISIIDRYANIEDATDKARELLKEDKTFSVVMIWNSHECMRTIKQK